MQWGLINIELLCVQTQCDDVAFVDLGIEC